MRRLLGAARSMHLAPLLRPRPPPTAAPLTGRHLSVSNSSNSWSNVPHPRRLFSCQHSVSQSLAPTSSQSPTVGPHSPPLTSTGPLSVACAQSLDHSLTYLLHHDLHAHAVAVYSAHPQLHSPPLSLRLLHCLPYSAFVHCPYTPFAQRVLLDLHRSGHLQPIDVDELYKRVVCRGCVPLASLCFRLLCAGGVIPPSLSPLSPLPTQPASQPRAATSQQKAAVYARLMLLQTYTAQRVIEAASWEVPVIVHAPITHTTLVLSAWCHTVQQQRTRLQQDAATGELEDVMLGEADVAMREADWHPFLWRQYSRAVQYRRSVTGGGSSQQSPSTPLFFLLSSRPTLPSPPHPLSSGAAMSLSDCLVVAEHMRLLSFLHSSAVLSAAPRLLSLSAHLLLYHLALLSSLCGDVAVSAALLDAQRFIHSVLLRRLGVEPALLTVNCVLHSWTAHLSILHSVEPSAAKAAEVLATPASSISASLRGDYAAFSAFFTSCFPSFVTSSLLGDATRLPTRSNSSPAAELQPNANSLLTFVSASTLYSSLSSPQLVAHASRTALALRQRNLAVSSPALLMMEQPLRHIEAMQQGRQADERSRRVADGAAMSMQYTVEQAAETGEERWNESEWQRLRNRAKRGNRSACATVVTHYLRSLHRSAEWWSTSPYLNCSVAGRLPTFRLVLHCTAAVCDLTATQTAWAHLLTLCPRPPRPLPWLYLSSLCHSHLRISRSSPPLSHPPPLSLSSFLSALTSLFHFHTLPLTASCRSLVLHVLLSTYLSPTSSAYSASGWKREVVGRLRTEALLVGDMANRWRPGERERMERVRQRRRAVEGETVDGEEWELSEYERKALTSYVRELQAVVVADEQLGVRGEWDRKGRTGGLLQLPAIAMQAMRLPHFLIIERTDWSRHTPVTQPTAARTSECS